jgi:flagellar basal-body rod protein FlgB
MEFIDKPATMVLEKSMDALWQRTRAQTDNIANATTPGYKRKVVAFEEELQDLLSSFSRGISKEDAVSRIRELQPRQTEDNMTNVNVDGNNVELDQEFIELTDTMIQYQYMQRLLSDNYSRLRVAIREGK